MASQRSPSLENGRAAGAPPQSPEGPAGESPVEALGKHLAVLADSLSYFLSVRADRVKLRIRRALWWAIAGAVGLVAGATALVVAVVLLLSGIAHGLAALLGGRLWAGELLVGFVVLFGAGLALALVAARGFQVSLRQTRQKYEQWQSRQRAVFGKDVTERARPRDPRV